MPTPCSDSPRCTTSLQVVDSYDRAERCPMVWSSLSSCAPARQRTGATCTTSRSATPCTRRRPRPAGWQSGHVGASPREQRTSRSGWTPTIRRHRDRCHLRAQRRGRLHRRGARRGVASHPQRRHCPSAARDCHAHKTSHLPGRSGRHALPESSTFPVTHPCTKSSSAACRGVDRRTIG